MFLGIFLFLAAIIVFNFIYHPEISPETLIIRAAGLTALVLLHVILCIGPLARLEQRFLPLLYNRRHLGVTMSIFALVHGVFSLIQFHGLGDTHPLISLFTSNTHYGSIMRYPFQPLGFFALLIILLMSFTSHDFWLKNLGPKFWKSMHMMVYLAYALVLLHVLLGAVQMETSLVWAFFIAAGMSAVIILHLLAAFRSSTPEIAAGDGFVEVCSIDEIEEDRAKTIMVGKENIAIFKYDGKMSAVSNLCKHQNGPLGEGKIIDGCITCPWHGYQYRPDDGCSPPPFTEKVATYELKTIEGRIYVNPIPHPEGTRVEPVRID